MHTRTSSSVQQYSRVVEIVQRQVLYSAVSTGATVLARLVDLVELSQRLQPLNVRVLVVAGR